ncbi:vacuolar protein sorting/targeting protein PEP1 [Conoideocrella luteorostrata]|uniref:Vacuolar protein sorting/targeting protein 10 n=1 Tax=Conoideocrella luteorostrata TaxID=1105319 RepID=A0AAJ0CAJ1_9HYPO|nr:vacuolar protein sorting/targeting protein PEP1 [Conoideocrella luteorostrata]
MRPGGKAAAAWRILLSSLMWTAAFAKDEPSMSVTSFQHAPRRLSYFEDSDVIVFQDEKEDNVYRSADAGVSWKRVDDVPDHKASELIMHRFDSKRAYILTEGTTHFRTDNRGETWTNFTTPSRPSKFQPEILGFHAGEPDRIIFNAMTCEGFLCAEQALYTIDGFQNTKPLRINTAGCWWAKSSPQFTTGEAEKDKSRVLCIVNESFSFFRQVQKLTVSDSFFAVVDKHIQEFEPNIDLNKGVSGSLNLAVVKKYIVIATSSPRSDEMSLFVTDDTLQWHRAMFPKDDNHDHSHRINQGGYTVLESTNYSIQVDVMTSHPSQPMGVLFTSNSNGTYFTENIPYTNRNLRGNVDFEKISGIQGIFLVNTVENGAEVAKKRTNKIRVTQITFDDGRTFAEIKAGDDRLHLHSVTELDNVGRVFSSPAPGLVMGNGNTGKSLGNLKDSNLYVSDNAGSTWKKALGGPHLFEFGDSGSVLMAIKDSNETVVKEISYSLDHGEKWNSVPLPKDLVVEPKLLTTTQDSTSLKFLFLGQKDNTYHLFAINFEGLKERTCEDKDMEDWHARADKDGNPTCVMGHKQTYRRRKKTADCFIKKEFKDILPTTEDCECTDADFECDYNFQRDPEDHKKCKQAGPVPSPDDYCAKHPDGKFQGSSGWRLIPGNTCKRAQGKQKDDKVERQCSDGNSKPSQPPATGEISRKEKVFDFKLKGFETIYLEKSDTSLSTNETVIVWPAGDKTQRENQIWMSHNHGKDWERILEGEKVRGIHPNMYNNDVVYFTMDKSDRIVYTIDRGQSFHSFKAPAPPRPNVKPFGFHPNNKDWLLWMGSRCQKVGQEDDCDDPVWISTNRGDKWDIMLHYAEKCEFTGNTAYKFRAEKQIICLASSEERKGANLTVITSDEFFQDKKKNVQYDRQVVNFATMSEFIILNTKDPKTGATRAVISLDGKTFEEANYPHNFHKGHHDEYTALDSSTHAVNLFVRSEAGKGRFFGSIIKSNSNGTSYVLSAANVNSNEQMYVDFEKVAGLEGVELINIVSNADTKEKNKILQTKISHNDGSQWGYLPPPAKDVDGKAYPCSSSKGDGNCALHFHHYTEREDKRRTFAADAAVGFMFGVGNVGSSLGDIKDSDTFMTTDGGITWTNVKKGHWTWQYGDQGSIMVLVQRATPKNSVKTKMISYSIDEGKTWKDMEFSDKEVTVLDISTVSSGTSRNFLLWCEDGDKMIAVNLDFSGLADKPCQYKKDSEAESDYTLWTPKHPLQGDDCLFGHKAKYLRKKTDRKCYNDQSLQLSKESENCECKREDFECAYNFEISDNSGQCSLVKGLDPLSGKELCSKNPNATSWFEPTGYRRIPLSTCEGGREMDKTAPEHPCEGHEEEFEKKHRVSGVAVFFAVVLPFAAAGAIGWYVYRNWDGKFGQIRLGESSSTFDSDRPWVKYPVVAVSAVAAVVVTLPLLAGGLWRWATSSYDRLRGGSSRSWFTSGPRRFTTRDSFSRGHGDYDAVVDDDEEELLGEDSSDDD